MSDQTLSQEIPTLPSSTEAAPDLDQRLADFLEALKSIDLNDGNLKLTAHSSSVHTSDWEMVQAAIQQTNQKRD